MPFQDINGKSIYYTRQSPGEYTTSILFIHGLGSSSSFYAPLVPALVSAGYDCIAFDTHGSGLSKLSSSQGTQSVQTIAQDVISLMSKLSLTPSKTVLVGHSMGGMIACELASKHPFSGIALLGPVHPTPELAPIFEARIAKVQKDGMECMADSIPKAATGTKSNALHWAFIRALLLAQESDGYSSLCKVIADATPPEYAKIQCPVLLLAGEDDKTSPLKNVQKIGDACGSKEDVKILKVLGGVGHWHAIEAGDEVNRELIEFLKTKVSA